MTYLLCCEGPRCNPNLTAIDAMRREYTKQDGGVPVGGPSLWSAQRTLKHTPHAMTALNRAVCEQCGHVRQYGNETIGWHA